MGRLGLGVSEQGGIMAGWVSGVMVKQSGTGNLYGYIKDWQQEWETTSVDLCVDLLFRAPSCKAQAAGPVGSCVFLSISVLGVNSSRGIGISVLCIDEKQKGRSRRGLGRKCGGVLGNGSGVARAARTGIGRHEEGGVDSWDRHRRQQTRACFFQTLPDAVAARRRARRSRIGHDEAARQGQKELIKLRRRVATRFQRPTT